MQIHDFVGELEERLLRYASIDTQANEQSVTSPSTAQQYTLLNLLVEELQEIGAQEVVLTPYGAVLARIPATAQLPSPTVAFLAHVDTAPAFHASGVKPIVHRAYEGGAIVLPDEPSALLSPENSPYLAQKIGDDIITASGKTLLGADDKAGVAILMTMARHLLQNPSIPHGPLRLAFTPDEEIGRGVHSSLPDDLAAQFAYTLDGAEVGEVVYETFSADKATVKIQGVSIHPGTAKDKLVNALHLAARIVETLPQVTRTPETTEGRQGFIHVYQMSGSANCTVFCAISSWMGWRPTALCCSRSVQWCRRPSRVPGLPARSRSSTATCVTGWKKTCGRSSWRVQPVFSWASSHFLRLYAGGPTAHD